MKTFLTALIMGTCGALAVFTSFSLHWPTWVMFIAWVSYYLFGRSLKTAAISLVQIASGIIMGIIMQSSAMGLSGLIGPLGFPVMVFILIGSLAYISKVKLLSNIPAWFIGLIIFFGVHPVIEPVAIIEIFIPIVAGFMFAFLNDNAVSLASRLSGNLN
ncbi:MAG TPA: DUF1097 domain-containing protein [Puia sp.]